MKPVLGNWIADHFPSPEIWYEAKMNFIKSTAIWSMIGYIIGLGDRHGDNILIHAHTGEVTHVDFDCIFEKGKTLPTAEIVQFRMTTNIAGSLGTLGPQGVFKHYFKRLIKFFHEHIDDIVGSLDSFIYDPLIDFRMQHTPKQALAKLRERIECLI